MKMSKRIVLLLLICLSTLSLSAQESAYEEIMNQKVAALDSIPPAEYPVLAADFAGILMIDGSDWIASYYAAYCRIIQAFGEKGQADNLCDEAENHLKKAENMNGDRSEIACLKSMVASARMLVDPQSRWQTYGAMSAQLLRQALEINPKNPRAYLLQGQNLFYTPAQFGGGKDIALPIIQKSVDYFEEETASPSYAPHWGKEQARLLLKQCQGE